MSQTLGIISKEDVCLKTLVSILSRCGLKILTDEGSFQVTPEDESEGRWSPYMMFIQSDKEVSFIAYEGYIFDEDYPIEFRDWVTPNKAFFTVIFNDFSFSRNILRILIQSLGETAHETWIDGDYEEVYHAPEFLTNLICDEMWDWRKA